jgi:uncharacterized protein (TIGR02391 family)
MTPSPDSSTLHGKRLHAALAKHVLSQFHAGFYEDAVLNAFKTLEERLRSITGAQEVGSKLVNTAFNKTAGVLTNPDAWPAEREGFFQFVNGAFLAFRNPSGHRFVGIDQDGAFDMVVLVNRILLITEEAVQRRNFGSVSGSSTPNIQYGTLAVSNPMMLDTDNDGTLETVLLKPGRHLQDVLPYGEGNLADPAQPISIYRSIGNRFEPMEMEQVETGILWGLDDVLLADVDRDGLNEVLCALTGMGTQGAYLLVYKYRNGQYEVLKGAPIGRKATHPVVVFHDGFVRDIDDDGELEITSQTKAGPLSFDDLPFDDLPEEYRVDAFGLVRWVWKWDDSNDRFRVDQRHVKVFGPGGWDDGSWESVPIT